MSTRTASIGIRVQPEVKAAAERAAQADHRTVASLVEKLLIEHLRAGGHLSTGDEVMIAADAASDALVSGGEAAMARLSERPRKPVGMASSRGDGRVLKRG